MLNVDVGETIVIRGESYSFAGLPGVSNILHCEATRTARVYKLLSGNQEFALKVFLDHDPDKALIEDELAKEFKKFAHIPGMEVCNRIVLTSSADSAILESYPDLDGAVLMPWIDGITLPDFYARGPYREEDLEALAVNFSELIGTLEDEGVLFMEFNRKGILVSSDRRVHLVDLDNVVPPMIMPIIDKEFTSRNNQKNQSAILIEILMCNELGSNRVLENPPLVQKDLSGLERRVENRYGKSIAGLYQQSRHAADDEELPSMREWNLALKSYLWEKAIKDAASLIKEDVSGESHAHSHKHNGHDANIMATIAYPRLLSKRFSTAFFVYLYPEQFLLQTKLAIDKELELQHKKNHDYQKKSGETGLKPGAKVKVLIECPGVLFSAPVAKQVTKEIVKIEFTAKPTDECAVGRHIAKLSIWNLAGIEVFSMLFEIKVVDYLFDHVSRPVMMNISVIASGLVAGSMYLLTFLEQVDKTIGLTSGTATLLLAFAIYRVFLNLYRGSPVTASA